jgi:hypothetical protein
MGTTCPLGDLADLALLQGKLSFQMLLIFRPHDAGFRGVPL